MMNLVQKITFRISKPTTTIIRNNSNKPFEFQNIGKGLKLPGLITSEVKKESGLENLESMYGKETDKVDDFHIININATYNNTIISLCTKEGKMVLNSSCGIAGFKKAKRAGYEPAYAAMSKLIEKIKLKGLNIGNLVLRFKGFGSGRDAAFQALRSITNWNIIRLIDCTPMPHNGCRPPKARRL